MPKLLSAIELAEVGTLPAASANTGTLMRTSAGAFYSNGTSWARIDNVVTDWATSLDNIPANIASWAGIAPGTKQDGAASSGANRLLFNTGQSTAMGTAAADLGGLELRGAGGANAAFMCFHRPGYYAAYFGLDTDNVWKVGGWSMGAVAHVVWHAGNTTALADALSLSGANNRLVARAGRRTAVQLQSTTLAAGLYANSGDGLLNAAGTAEAHPGWWHVAHSYHDVDGYASQIATELAAGFRNQMLMRSSDATVWKEWTEIFHSGNLLNIGTTAATARAALVMATTDNVILRDVTVARADGTGVLFMNSSQTRYLAWNNTTYVVNVAAGEGEIWHTLATPGGGNRLSKITCSSAAPGTLQDGELYLRF